MCLIYIELKPEMITTAKDLAEMSHLGCVIGETFVLAVSAYPKMYAWIMESDLQEVKGRENGFMLSDLIMAINQVDEKKVIKINYNKAEQEAINKLFITPLKKENISLLDFAKGMRMLNFLSYGKEEKYENVCKSIMYKMKNSK